MMDEEEPGARNPVLSEREGYRSAHDDDADQEVRAPESEAEEPVHDDAQPRVRALVMWRCLSNSYVHVRIRVDMDYHRGNHR